MLLLLLQLLFIAFLIELLLYAWESLPYVLYIDYLKNPYNKFTGWFQREGNYYYGSEYLHDLPRS